MCSSTSTISIEKILNKYKHESLSIDDTAAQLEKHFKQVSICLWIHTYLLQKCIYITN